MAYDCEMLYETDMWIPGFDPDKNYIVRDHLGKEHEVVNTNHIADGITQTSAVPYRGPARIYNLQGQRIRPQRGLNIVGGRKVWVK